MSNPTDTNQASEDELRAEILTEFKQVYKLAPYDYTENCTNVVMALIEAEYSKRELEARVDELKQLEPPEQYEDYAKIMGSESCTICGFNAIVFRKHISNRIAELKRTGDKSLGQLVKEGKHN